jgi:hypothetical protein
MTNQEREQRLQDLLEAEKQIPIKEHIVTNLNTKEKIIIKGRVLPRNKLLQERAAGYMNYIEDTEGTLHKFSAFSYYVVPVQNI